MFTGIIAAVGHIKQISPLNKDKNSGLRLAIVSNDLDLSDVNIGDSISVNGACLTVTTIEDKLFTVDVSQETLTCCCNLDSLNKPVNLEKAMRLSDRLNGHLVSGHVDGIGEVVNFKSIGESFLLSIKLPEPLLKFTATKGSITVNGVSLTINQLVDDCFSVNLIPHTLAVTTLKELSVGEKVNIETDLLARHVARLISISN